MEIIECLRCGEKLIVLRCKLQCPKCGYTEDCADATLTDYEVIERRARRRPQPSHKASSEDAPKRYSMSL